MVEESIIFKDAVGAFQRVFDKDPEVAVFAPGRVNLIGEHTDYNDGFVLPMAIPFKTIVVGSLSHETESKIFSTNINIESEQLVSFVVDKGLSVGLPKWANYVKGTVYHYLNDLPKGFSFNAVISSDVPSGSGLSSSAALE